MLQQNSHVGNMWEQESEVKVRVKFYMQDTLDFFQKVFEATTLVGVKAAYIQMTFLWCLTLSEGGGHRDSEGFVLIGSCREKHYICYLRHQEIKLRDKQKALDEISPAKSLLWSVQEHTNAPKQADIWNQCELLHNNIMGTENKAKTCKVPLWLNIQTHTCSWK